MRPKSLSRLPLSTRSSGSKTNFSWAEDKNFKATGTYSPVVGNAGATAADLEKTPEPSAPLMRIEYA